MKRTTVTMPEHTHARLEREARRRHTSVSAIVRECVDSKFPGSVHAEGPRHIPFAGIFSGDLGFDAADMDDYLEKHWVDDLLREIE